MTDEIKVDITKYLSGVTKKWLDVLTSDGALTELVRILKTIETFARVEPPAKDMFNFARFSFDNIKIVIVGMDPYPTPGDAHGLCFSSKKTGNCPASLNKIYNVLIENKLIEEKPDNYDLSYLAAQGILLLNSALSVESQKPGSHIKIWAPWSQTIIKRLNTQLAAGTIWCLWGGDAQKLVEPLVDAKRHEVWKWAHPVAPVNPNFSKCDHFSRISAKYPDIIWDPRKTETHFYTDCSARNNQSKTCRASFGVVCTRGLLKGQSWGGVSEPREIISKGQTIIARPTNIRGEGEGLIRALEIAHRLPARVKIHTDSKFWMDMVKQFIPDRIERGGELTSFANSDLVIKIWALSQTMGTRVEFVFVNAWHDRNCPTLGTDDRAWWDGNKAAEAKAESVLGL